MNIDPLLYNLFSCLSISWLSPLNSDSLSNFELSQPLHWYWFLNRCFLYLNINTYMDKFASKNCFRSITNVLICLHFLSSNSIFWAFVPLLIRVCCLSFIVLCPIFSLLFIFLFYFFLVRIYILWYFYHF